MLKPHGQLLKPFGHSIRDAFDKIQKSLQPVAENVFVEIDKIHGIPLISKIDLTQINATAFDGEFEYYKSGRGVRIKISSNAINKEFALLHEIGHLIDNQAIGFKGSNESEMPNNEFAEIFIALKKTDAIKRLSQMQASGKYAYMGKIRKLTDNQIASINYLLQPKEQWARAYSQYISTKSQNEILQKQLNKQLKSTEILTEQWVENDFENIIFAIDKFLNNGRNNFNKATRESYTSPT